MRKRTVIFGLGIAVVLLGIVAVLTQKITFRSPIVFLDEPQQIIVDDLETAHTSSTRAVEFIADESTEPVLSVSGLVEVDLPYGSKRISVEKGCVVFPKEIVAGVQERILIENNTESTRTLSFVGQRSYAVPAEGFTVAAFTTAGVFQLECDTRLTGATVVITG